MPLRQLASENASVRCVCERVFLRVCGAFFSFKLKQIKRFNRPQRLRKLKRFLARGVNLVLGA